MRYKRLGRTGLRVSEAALGTMNFVNSDWGIDSAQSRKVLDSYASAGGVFLDTAPIYSAGESERLVGDFIKSDRDHFVVATKYGVSHADGIMKSGASRREMIRSVEASLKRLETDRIDLLYLHWWDETCGIDEVMRTFDDLVRSGKVQYVALSNTPAWIVSRAQTLAETGDWTPLAAIQVEFNLAQRAAERDLLPMARELGLGSVVWGPLAGGLLARPEGGPRQKRRDAQATPEARRIADVVGELAEKHRVAPASLALAGLLRMPFGNDVIPIIGASSREQLVTNLEYLELALEDEDVRSLQEASKSARGVPHDMLASPTIRNLLVGGSGQSLTP
ncbi:hypothetical protein LK12_22300 [Novosphingobium malaysiense]|uniref:NADP-dependent oxidoreductase domain-containing protein n=2 Tax=Novosphingobium malaysiense TaxID=1348853 RepID=A0A0B1ZIP9_9SPHN|nr:hypothetical protein LK12_22300 [Novosphingobium malaysiense]